MAINFTCPEAPTSKAPCRFCLEWDEDMKTGDDGRCDQWCDGFETVHSDPRVQVGYSYRLRFLGLLGLPIEEWGEITPEQIPAVLQRIMVVLAVPSSRAHLVEEPEDRRAFDTPRIVEDPETGLPTISRGCRVISPGISDDRIRRRLEGVRELLVYARERDYTVQWD